MTYKNITSSYKFILFHLSILIRVYKQNLFYYTKKIEAIIDTVLEDYWEGHENLKKNRTKIYPSTKWCQIIRTLIFPWRYQFKQTTLGYRVNFKNNALWSGDWSTILHQFLSHRTLKKLDLKFVVSASKTYFDKCFF